MKYKQKTMLVKLNAGYCLGGGPFGLLGLQAKGLPSGAQQTPFSVPWGVEKLQSLPAGKVLQAAIASAGGGPPIGPPLFIPFALAFVCANNKVLNKVISTIAPNLNGVEIFIWTPLDIKTESLCNWIVDK